MIHNKIHFLGSEFTKSDYNSSKIVFIPAPYEYTTSYYKGTKLGPKKILEASQQLEIFDSELNLSLQDNIFTLKELEFKYRSQEEDLNLIQKAVLKELENQKWPIILGGEHTITGPIIQAFKEYYQSDFGVVHFDAHFDLRDTYLGEKLSHATMLRRVREQTKSTLSLGVRSFSKEERDHALAENILYVTDKELSQSVDLGVYLKRLPEQVYLTIDLDFFDLGIFPGVGTPVPGGLGWW
ncbi:MAG: agmatinase, partial [Candidatus Margulisiibacteriota bacterium]